MKKFIKLSALIFAVLMMTQMFWACKKDEKPEDETTTVEVTEDPTDARGFVKDSLPSGLNFDKTVKILCWEAERDEFESRSEEPTGDNVLDAILGRNLAVEERLGVKLEFEQKSGNAGTWESFVDHVDKAYKSGEHTYDIVAAYSRTAGALATKGLYMDLNSVEDSYIDFGKPWWPEYLVDTLTVGNSLYYISGDASTNTLHFMYGIYYNKDLLTDLGLPDPAKEYVEQKKWTLDKLISLSSNQYQDADGDGKSSVGDKFGFGSAYAHVDAFYTGSGLKLVEKTGNEDLLRVSPDYFSQKAINLIDKLGAWMAKDDCRVNQYGGASLHAEESFVNGDMLFMQNRVYAADKQSSCQLHNVEWVYGLLPTPMYDESQSDYITVLGNPFTLYGIMANAPDPVMTSAVLECWGSEAYRRTTPEIFEVNMKYKYTQEEISARMFDILRRTCATDLGRIYGMILGPHISEFPSRAAAAGQQWASLSKKYERPLNVQIKSIIKAFQSLQ